MNPTSRLTPDRLDRTAPNIPLHSQALRVLMAYGTGNMLLDHDAYRLAGLGGDRGTHQRCSDLRSAGYISRTNHRGMTPSGKAAWLCRITPAGVLALERMRARV